MIDDIIHLSVPTVAELEAENNHRKKEQDEYRSWCDEQRADGGCFDVHADAVWRES